MTMLSANDAISSVEIEFTVLGSGTRALREDRSMSSYALRCQGFFLLMDCGDGALRRALTAGLPLIQVDAVLISHLHLDHIADLPPLLWALHGEGAVRAHRPLRLYGPPGLFDFYQRMGDLYGSWINDIPVPIVVQEVFEQDFEVGPWHARTLAMHHSILANGYRLQCERKTIAYTGDTGPGPGVIRLAREAELFICECAFPNGQDMPTHLNAGQAGQIAAEAKCEKLLLTHFYPEALAVDVAAQAREFFSGQVELAQDLMRLMI